MKKTRKVALAATAALAAIAGYAGLVYVQALNVDVDTAPQTQALILAGPSAVGVHDTLVHALAFRRATGLWPSLTALSSGYDEDMLRAQEAIAAHRTVWRSNRICLEEGAMPVDSRSIEKGSYPLLNGTTANLEDDGEQLPPAFAEPGVLVAYTGTGSEGVTRESASTPGLRWLAPLVRSAPVRTAPMSACASFDIENASGIAAGVAKALYQEAQGWTWQDPATGVHYEFKRQGRGLRLEVPDLEPVLGALRSALSAEGTPTWDEMHLKVQRSDWPADKAAGYMTFKPRGDGDGLMLTYNARTAQGTALVTWRLWN